MRSGGATYVTVRFNPVSSSYVDEDIPLPQPPPPLSINQNDSSVDGNANLINLGVDGFLQTGNGEGRQLWEVMPMVEPQV
ncbi:hypothetical protein C1H46_035879 [Malus baccata]|uniref:Uncharacterized protein n=1 Tax=Malus baccata TaxID=106549 RepID=A0A540KWD7_MALBA|nr:hypothetical protein C1H46_035879 [Malus baccata]